MNFLRRLSFALFSPVWLVILVANMFLGLPACGIYWIFTGHDHDEGPFILVAWWCDFAQAWTGHVKP